MTIRVAIKSDCESRAEKELFRMASLLSDDWLVWMNRELNFETPSGYMNREVDCIIYHPQHGMLLIECKSGMISAQHDSESCQLQWLQSGNLLKCLLECKHVHAINQYVARIGFVQRTNNL